jgi:glycosyltransferase involved in cell wall biosynthesis
MNNGTLGGPNGTAFRDGALVPDPAADPTELSVIVPFLNEEATIGDTLGSLAFQSWDGSWELILADNGSTDRSVEVAEGYRGRLPALRIVDASDRRGGAFARNRGAGAARGTSLAFVDADDEVAPGWLAAIGEALREHRFVASRFEYEKLNAPSEAGIRGGVQSEGLQRLWYSPQLPHAGGCGLGIRRSLFSEVGGFDEEMPRLVDTDLCIRVQERGVELHFVEDARVHVRLRSTSRGAFRQARQWACYNTLLHRRYRSERPDPVASWRRYLRGWRAVLGHLKNPTSLARSSKRMRLAWSAGWHLGLLEGALRYGVAPVAKDRSREPRAAGRGAGVSGGRRA